MNMSSWLERWTKRTPAGCWEWQGRTHKGYGKHGDGGTAHRFVYERVVGAVGAGLELDHLCRNTLCCNPEHLEPVTREENMRRRYADYDECTNGHPYDAANTYIRPSGHRDCRACIRDRARRYQAKRRAA